MFFGVGEKELRSFGGLFWGVVLGGCFGGLFWGAVLGGCFGGLVLFVDVIAIVAVDQSTQTWSCTIVRDCGCGCVVENIGVVAVVVVVVFVESICLK